jgi:uncharacterized protein YggU (UPF0235/DUF167 family)
VRIAIRLTPRARADCLHGVARLADGALVLRVSVTAPPAEGQANDALLRLLAGKLGVAWRDLAIVGGVKSRNKIVAVAGDPPLLRARLANVLAAAAKP